MASPPFVTLYTEAKQHADIKFMNYSVTAQVMEEKTAQNVQKNEINLKLSKCLPARAHIDNLSDL